MTNDTVDAIDIKALKMWLEGMKPGHTLSWRKEVQIKMRARAHIYAARVVADAALVRDAREVLDRASGIMAGIGNDWWPRESWVEVQARVESARTILAALRGATK